MNWIQCVNYLVTQLQMDLRDAQNLTQDVCIYEKPIMFYDGIKLHYKNDKFYVVFSK